MTAQTIHPTGNPSGEHQRHLIPVIAVVSAVALAAIMAYGMLCSTLWSPTFCIQGAIGGTALLTATAIAIAVLTQSPKKTPETEGEREGESGVSVGDSSDEESEASQEKRDSGVAPSPQRESSTEQLERMPSPADVLADALKEMPSFPERHRFLIAEQLFDALLTAEKKNFAPFFSFPEKARYYLSELSTYGQEIAAILRLLQTDEGGEQWNALLGVLQRPLQEGGAPSDQLLLAKRVAFALIAQIDLHNFWEAGIREALWGFEEEGPLADQLLKELEAIQQFTKDRFNSSLALEMPHRVYHARFSEDRVEYVRFDLPTNQPSRAMLHLFLDACRDDGKRVLSFSDQWGELASAYAGTLICIPLPFAHLPLSESCSFDAFYDGLEGGYAEEDLQSIRACLDELRSTFFSDQTHFNWEEQRAVRTLATLLVERYFIQKHHPHYLHHDAQSGVIEAVSFYCSLCAQGRADEPAALRTFKTLAHMPALFRGEEVGFADLISVVRTLEENREKAAIFESAIEIPRHPGQSFFPTPREAAYLYTSEVNVSAYDQALQNHLDREPFELSFDREAFHDLTQFDRDFPRATYLIEGEECDEKEAFVSQISQVFGEENRDFIIGTMTQGIQAQGTVLFESQFNTAGIERRVAQTGGYDRYDVRQENGQPLIEVTHALQIRDERNASLYSGEWVTCAYPLEGRLFFSWSLHPSTD